jgi:peptidoglycan hydrolase-like protein with peptidoglycan-binding domain
MSDSPDLNPGDEGEWVTYLQQTLEYQGYSPGDIDGVFNEATANAVRAFQEANGLPANGVVDAQLWEALAGSASGSEAGDDAGIAAWGPDPEEWTPDQQDQYFALNDDVDEAEGLDADLDVPEIDEEATA